MLGLLPWQWLRIPPDVQHPNRTSAQGVGGTRTDLNDSAGVSGGTV